MTEAHAAAPNPEPTERLATILVVEDEVIIRANVSEFLQDEGFKVLTAASADEALEIVRKGSAEIRLVFSDVRMPGSMDGLGLARWLKANRPHICVILSSGYFQQPAALQDFTAGGEPLFPKPYNLEHLAMRVRNALKLEAMH